MNKFTPPSSGTADSFIDQAPDAKPSRLSIGKQCQISLAMPQSLLDKVDAAAKALNLTRAGFIKMCLSNAVKQ